MIAYLYEAIAAFLEGSGKVRNIAVEIQKRIAMGKKVRISDESVNCYGTRIITSGIDLTQYERNPVLLYMHDRSQGVVGLVKNLKVENGELTGEIEFDGATELSQRLKKQYEFGSMRMVSANLQILETSDDKSLVLEGQTAQTITKSRLFEVSAVDIGGNDNAIVLYSPDGEQLPLMKGEESESAFLPLLNSNINPLKKEVEMELKTLALQLGLSETADEATVLQKLGELKLKADGAAALQKQVDELKVAQETLALAGITAAVDQAVSEKRIDAGMKDHFVELAKVGIDTLKLTLSAMQPQGKLSVQLHRTSTGQIVAEETDFSKYEKLSAVPSGKMMDLHDNHPEEFVRLYKAEYGFEPA